MSEARFEMSANTIPPRRIMKTPRRVEIFITSRCNLKCEYCCHFTSSSDVEKDLNTADWLAFFEVLGRARVMTVNIVGGEPFTRPDFLALLDGIANNNMRYNIITNGTLIDEAIASHIAETNRCSEVTVSIDGADAWTNDRFRGNGSFKAATKGIAALKRYDLPVSATMTINKSNVNKLEEIAHFFLDRLGLFRFHTNSTSYLGKARERMDEFVLNAQDRSLAMRTLFDLRAKYNGRIGGRVGPIFEADIWTQLDQSSRNRGKGNGDEGRLRVCEQFYDSITVRSDGVLVPCGFLSHIELGDVTKSDFVDVWQNSDQLNILRSRNCQSMEDLSFCRNCRYVQYCTGGCPALAYSRYGDVNRPSFEGCLRQFLADGGILPKLHIGPIISD